MGDRRQEQLERKVRGRSSLPVKPSEKVTKEWHRQHFMPLVGYNERPTVCPSAQRQQAHSDSKRRRRSVELLVQTQKVAPLPELLTDRRLGVPSGHHNALIWRQTQGAGGRILIRC